MAVAGALALGGCNTDGTGQLPLRAMTPLSAEMKAELARKNMPDETPILVRIFKEEAELEVWKQDATGKFALLKTYPICRWSGDLGPKVKEGDRQAPEGFYSITPGLMNPNSNYYLAFNLGFPNAYDKANDRTGAFLMVHGDCSSRGCYAMTDEQMGEIFALGRDSFQGGQRSFQVQAYPFRMTPKNMARHRNSPHMAFWKMIKQGYDHFEVTRLEPRVDVCDRRYVFDAESPNGRPLVFDPRGRCPQYLLNPDYAQAIRAKQARDEAQIAELSRNTTVAKSRSHIDGGMHPTFAAKLKPKKILDGLFETKVVGAQPGHMGNNVVPPADVQVEMASVAPTESPQTAAYTAPQASAPARSTSTAAPAAATPAPSATTTTASAQPGTLARIGQFFGIRNNDAAASKPAAPAATAPAPKAVAETKPKPAPAAKPVQTAQPAPSPSQRVAQVPAEPPATTASTPAQPPLINGAVAPLPTSSFDSRWGGGR